MDNQEAIKTFYELLRETNDSWYEEVYKMAIEALLVEENEKEKITGISIKNMKMPSNCMECSLCYDMIYCAITGTHMDFERMDYERLDDCPLEEYSICKED